MLNDNDNDVHYCCAISIGIYIYTHKKDDETKNIYNNTYININQF